MTDPATVLSASHPATVLRESWDEHAEEWIAWVRAPGRRDTYWRFHRELFMSLVPSPGQLTLDVGCGEGRVGRDLQALGHTVLGIDCSFTMCQAAATHPDPSRVIVGDAVSLPLADATADCAIAFMALQDIDDMPGAVNEIARVLKDDHKFALAIVHPMYSGGRFSEAGENLDHVFEIKRSYFKPELCTSTDFHDSLTVTFYREHRPLQAYVQALTKAGFIIEQLYEVTDDDEGKPWYRIPMFLDIVATRRPREKATDSAYQPGGAYLDAVRPTRLRRLVHRKGAENSQGRRLGHSPPKIVPSTPRIPKVRSSVAGWPVDCSGSVLSWLILVATKAFAMVYRVRDR